MELELFTLSVKEDGTISVAFNEELLEIATEEELISAMNGKMDGLIPITKGVVDFLKTKI